MSKKRQSWLTRWTRRGWLQIEEVAVNLTGPALLIGSILQAIAYFENQALLINDPWIVNVWAIARAAGVVLWPVIGVGYLRRTLKAKGNPLGWIVLIGGLGLVELQIGMTFYSWTSHETDWGWLAFLNIPGVELAGEYVILGVVLTIVGRIIMDINEDADVADVIDAAPAQQLTPETLALAFTQALASHAASSTVAVTAPPLARSNVQAADSAVLRRDAPAARRAYHHGAVAPIIMEGSNEDVYDPIRYVSEDEPDEPDEPDTPRERPASAGVTRRTHSRRSDSGRSAADVAARRARLLELLYVDPRMSISQIMAAIDVKSRPTAVSYRDAARRQLINQYPEREADWRAAWGEAWEKLV